MAESIHQGIGLLRQGDHFWRCGLLTQARECYYLAFSGNPQNSEIPFFLGTLAHQREHHQEAIRWFGIARLLGNQEAALFNNWGESFRVLGRFRDAAFCFANGMKILPEMAQLHNNLGLVRLAQGKRPDALVCFENAIRLQPDYAKAHRNLGRVLQDLGRIKQARVHFARAQSGESWPENTRLAPIDVRRSAY